MAVGGGWGGGARRKQKQEKVLEFYQKMFKQTLKEKKFNQNSEKKQTFVKILSPEMSWAEEENEDFPKNFLCMKGRYFLLLVWWKIY